VTDEEEVIFTESGNDRVRKIDRNGILSTIAGDGHTSTLAPTGVCQYKNETYIAEVNNYRIRKVLQNGSIVTVAGTNQMDFNGDGILATQANIGNSHSLYVHNDEVYFTDRYNHRIRKIRPNGTITTIAGTGKAEFNGDGKLAVEANVYLPIGIFVDTDSQVYFSDYGSHYVGKIDNQGIFRKIVGSGVAGYAGDVPFDFHNYPHIGTRKKQIKPFPNAYHDLLLMSSTSDNYEPFCKKIKI